MGRGWLIPLRIKGPFCLSAISNSPLTAGFLEKLSNFKWLSKRPRCSSESVLPKNLHTLSISPCKSCRDRFQFIEIVFRVIESDVNTRESNRIGVLALNGIESYLGLEMGAGSA